MKKLLICILLSGITYAANIHSQGMSLYKSGKNVEAFKLFEKSCKQGQPHSCHNVGWFYDQGLVGSINKVKAFKIYKKACKLGSANSCYNLGRWYRTGKFVSKDPVEAHKYYSKACDLKDKESCQMKAMIEAGL